jgi:hypothetical protein
MTPQEKARQLRPLIEKAAVSLTDTDALDAVELFEHWAVGHSVSIGDRLEYGGKLYKCVQTHTTAAEWPPDATPALWTEVAKPSEIPVWKQLTGAQDAYMTGEKVHYPDADGPVYVSTVDNNTWVPGVYGWEVVE